MFSRNSFLIDIKSNWFSIHHHSIYFKFTVTQTNTNIKIFSWSNHTECTLFENIIRRFYDQGNARAIIQSWSWYKWSLILKFQSSTNVSHRRRLAPFEKYTKNHFITFHQSNLLYLPPQLIESLIQIEHPPSLSNISRPSLSHGRYAPARFLLGSSRVRLWTVTVYSVSDEGSALLSRPN